MKTKNITVATIQFVASFLLVACTEEQIKVNPSAENTTESLNAKNVHLK